MNYEDKIKKVAKTLVKEWKTEKSKSILIEDAFEWVGTNDKSGYWFRYHDSKFHLFFGNLDDVEMARLTRNVASAIDGILKLPKKMRLFKDERTHTKWGMWSSYDYTSVVRYVIITPSKEFLSINKKLVKLGLKPVPFAKWFHGGVFGKRSNWHLTSKHFYAEDEKKCAEVLAYLKGKKKVSYELVREEHFEDMEHGIEYETEWDGHLYYHLRFTDTNGKKSTF